MMNVVRFSAILLLAASLASTAPCQDAAKDPPAKDPAKESTPDGDAKKVYRNVSPQKLEAILKELKIDFDKSKGKAEGIDFYDFVRNDYKIRLHNYRGNDLWIDAQFADKMTHDDINRWNVMAKFSRAVQLKGDRPAVSLESQIDCLGGTTDAIIRQFITRFDGELTQFSQYVSKLAK